MKGSVVGDVAFANRVAVYVKNKTDQLFRCVQRITIEIQRTVKQDKLSGQVLNVRSGKLRRSINQFVEIEGDNIVGTVGTDQAYGPVHEYGGTFVQHVRAHQRRVKATFSKKRGAKLTVMVRAHVRRVTFPERSFLRSALADKKDWSKKQIQQVMNPK